MPVTAILADAMLDAGLAYLTNTTVLHLCSDLPANYAGVASVSLAHKDTPTIGAAEAATGGRKRVVAAISDGTVDGDGTATHFALVSGSVLIAAGPLNASQAVATGNGFTLTAFDITLLAPI
jgi:hypothetical protein